MLNCQHEDKCMFDKEKGSKHKQTDEAQKKEKIRIRIRILHFWGACSLLADVRGATALTFPEAKTVVSTVTLPLRSLSRWRRTMAHEADEPQRKLWPITLCATHFEFKSFRLDKVHHRSWLSFIIHNTMRNQYKEKQWQRLVPDSVVTLMKCIQHGNWDSGRKRETRVIFIFPLHMYKAIPHRLFWWDRKQKINDHCRKSVFHYAINKPWKTLVNLIHYLLSPKHPWKMRAKQTDQRGLERKSSATCQWWRFIWVGRNCLSNY